jgi:hypothetical protein
MAFAYVQDTVDLKWEDYERVDAELGSTAPDGLIVHVAGPHGGGVRIIDVWESEEAFERFREERLVPAVTRVVGEQQVAQGPPPNREVLDVQNVIRP